MSIHLASLYDLGAAILDAIQNKSYRLPFVCPLEHLEVNGMTVRSHGHCLERLMLCFPYMAY
jgi:hypothetical protein